jgi:hypothetical protein
VNPPTNFLKGSGVGVSFYHLVCVFPKHGHIFWFQFCVLFTCRLF